MCVERGVATVIDYVIVIYKAFENIENIKMDEKGLWQVVTMTTLLFQYKNSWRTSFQFSVSSKTHSKIKLETETTNCVKKKA